MPKITVRKGQAQEMHDRQAFGERFRQRFADPAFEAERPALERIEEIAWQGYSQSRKSPRTRPAGAGFAEPDYELSEDWLQTRDRLHRAQERWADPATPPDTTSTEWMRAVAFYRSRAYDQLYRWSWSQAPVEYSEFKGLIRESNDANRRALQDLGVIIANHVLSTVDAYITVRLRRNTESNGFALRGSIPFSLFLRLRSNP